MYAYLHQVLSETVSKALKITGGEEAEGTSKFTETMNKFFDCFNVHNNKHGIELCKILRNHTLLMTLILRLTTNLD